MELGHEAVVEADVAARRAAHGELVDELEALQSHEELLVHAVVEIDAIPEAHLGLVETRGIGEAALLFRALPGGTHGSETGLVTGSVEGHSLGSAPAGG